MIFDTYKVAVLVCFTGNYNKKIVKIALLKNIIGAIKLYFIDVKEE